MLWLCTCAAELALVPTSTPAKLCDHGHQPALHKHTPLSNAAPHPAQVYYIAQVQEAEGDAGVGDACGDSAPATLLRGPFNAKQPEVMAALSQLAKVHYVYVCRKSPVLMAAALQAVEAQRQQEAALRAAQAGQQAGSEGEGGEAAVVVDRKAAQERS